jgi:hypothetical protein
MFHEKYSFEIRYIVRQNKQFSMSYFAIKQTPKQQNKITVKLT